MERQDKGEQMLAGKGAAELWHIVFLAIQI